MNPNLIEELNSMLLSDLLDLQDDLKKAITVLKNQQGCLEPSKYVSPFIGVNIAELENLLAEAENAMDYGYDPDITAD